MALVIDDWHRVTDSTTVAALEYLIDNSCHHLQLVVTGRTGSGLPLSRMRVRDELIEIDSTALRFDDAEAHIFLVELGGLALKDPDISRIRRSTTGGRPLCSWFHCHCVGALTPPASSRSCPVDTVRSGTTSCRTSWTPSTRARWTSCSRSACPNASAVTSHPRSPTVRRVERCSKTREEGAVPVPRG